MSDPTQELDKAFGELVASAKPTRTKGRKGRVQESPSTFSDLTRDIDPGSEPQMSSAADELLLYADNEEPVYRQVLAIRENLRKKLRKGNYNHTLAPKLWTYAADNASQRYQKDIGREGIFHAAKGSGSHAFSAPVRREVGNYMAWRFIKDAQGGEYD